MSPTSHPEGQHRPVGGDPPGRPDPARGSAPDLALSTTAGPDGEVLVTAIGEIDMRTGPDLLSGLGAALERPGLRSLVVDLRGVRFLGASGIGVLVTAGADATARGVGFALVADQFVVLRPLEITGCSDRVGLFPTVTAARTGRRDA